MKAIKLSTAVLISLICLCPIWAQQGDQILDGIGETALIARYTFQGHVKDWSRNNLHASTHGTSYHYLEDETFSKAIVFHENNQSYISLPSHSLVGQESICITGWLHLNSAQKASSIFDFGKQGNQHLSTSIVTDGEEINLLTILQTSTQTHKIVSPTIALKQWTHLVVVVNATSKTLSTYINGTLVGKENILASFDDVIDQSNNQNNKLYIGKDIESNNTLLNTKLHDFRIYSIALNTKQIKRIHDNALQEEKTVNTKEESEHNLPQYLDEIPQLYTAYLTAVENIKAETTIGTLPYLPRYLKGTYSHHINGPLVRVIWPSPKDNNKVLTAGNYTIEGYIAGSDLKPKAQVTITSEKRKAPPSQNVETFNLTEVQLNNTQKKHSTQFIKNRDKFILELAKSNPDDFLYMFRNAYGQEQPKGAQALGVWDSQESKLRGHATGHYLSAIAQAYSSTYHNPELQTKFAKKMTYMVNTLYELSQLSGQQQTPDGEYISEATTVKPQEGDSHFSSDLSLENIRHDYWNWGKGYISAYPPDQFIMLEKGAKYGTENSKIWAPYYTLHKILSGLMDIYAVSNNTKALTIVTDMSDWVYGRINVLPKAKLISMWNRYIAGEFGGMNEALARLYRITNEPRYLEAAQLFDNTKLFYGDAQHSHGLAKNVDMIRGLHANQHIPQIIGALEIYRASKTHDYYYIADNFWRKTTNDYMYCIGGVAGASNPTNAECFTSEPASLYHNGLSEGGQNETCATYNMLKLSQNLFLFEQHCEYMDYYERGLYNHILASVAEHTAANTYHVPLRAGAVKSFSNANMKGFTCCNGTALESNTKLQNAIYCKSSDNETLYVNLYIPSSLTWTEKNVKIKQTTAFPNDDRSTLRVEGEGEFNLKVRVPHWATKGFEVLINGKKQGIEAKPSTYLTLYRKWKNGDTIELHMPFSFYLEPIMDQQNIASLFYGPILLAAQETEPLQEWRKIRLNVQDISKSITGNKEQLEFVIDGINFKPFYETYGNHSVYLNVNLK